MKVDESGRKWMKVDESGLKWMKVDENGLKQMKMVCEFKIVKKQQYIQHTHDLSAEGAKADKKKANA